MGLRLGDIYIDDSTKLPGGIVFKPSFHWFGAADGGFDYGKEVNAVLAKKINDHFTVLAKYAYYFTDRFAEDTTAFSIQLGYVY